MFSCQRFQFGFFHQNGISWFGPRTVRRPQWRIGSYNYAFIVTELEQLCVVQIRMTLNLYDNNYIKLTFVNLELNFRPD